jgi:hypothetical protein
LPETQASYAVINSSHSGTPIFSPAAAVDVVAVAGVVLLVALLVLAGAAFWLFVGVSDLAHPNSTMVQAMQSNKDVFFNI